MEFTPIRLWQWGEENLRYHGRQFPDDHLARYLWPEAKLKVTRRGLQFYRGLWYMGTALQEQPWFLEAMQKEREFSARVHPQDLSRLYLLPNEPRTPMLPVPVTKRSERFTTRTLTEFLSLQSQKRRQNAKAAWDNKPLSLQMTNIIEGTVTEATSMSKAVCDRSLSNSGHLADMRANRAEELAHMSQEALAGAFGSSPPGTTIDAEPSRDDPQADQMRKLVDQLLTQE